MIIAKFVAVTLVTSAAAGPLAEPSAVRLTLQQKNAATQTYVQSATDCIVRTVAAHARFRKDNPAANLAELIVESVPHCVVPVRAMIAAYDRYFGDGFGEQFFMGPYLDVLPEAVAKLTSGKAD
ncbi:MAG: hypothetical protein K2Y27_02210 [Xanthobacteraceae bacterium]|nr:hypothetical protein [Xanthobacteraceae bacterium]